MDNHLVVIGGGAAGFFCAANVAAMDPGIQVTILEKAGKLLSKVRVSGGGRCNVTHACFNVPELVRHYPRGQTFLKKAFSHFSTKDTVEWFHQRGIRLKTEADGRMFPVSDSSESIIKCLIDEVEKHHVRIELNSDVSEISFEEKESPGKFKVRLQNGNTLLADHLCIACGGFPKQTQYHWIEALGHQVTPPVASLFTFNVTDEHIKLLMGISVPNALVKIKGTPFNQHGPLLITHWGFSGPAVLKLSAFAARELASVKYNFTVVINWLGDIHEHALLEQLRKIRIDLGKRNIVNRNPFALPLRLWEYHLNAASISPNINWSNLLAKQQNLLAKNLTSQEFIVKSKTTFKEEFVTAGGVRLNEISPETMESKIIERLHFAGEIMDVDGITGGFNFQHAWTSGFIVARAIARNKSSIY